MTPAELHRKALDRTAALIAAIDPAQYALPTPCPEFTVRDLLAHLVSGNQRFTAVARGVHAVDVPLVTELPDGDALAAYRETSDEVAAAWSDPAVLDKPAELPFGTVPGAFALSIHTVEQVVHGWDLAQATGQPTEIPAELYDVAWAGTKDLDDSLRGPGKPFGPPVEPPAGASDTDRLVAWLGRHP